MNTKHADRPAEMRPVNVNINAPLLVTNDSKLQSHICTAKLLEFSPHFDEKKHPIYRLAIALPMDDASKAMQSWQVIELIAETNAVKLEHNKLVDQFNLQGLQMLELQKQHIRINKTVEEVTTAFMRFQGQVGMARGVPPILLRVSDRGHFGTSVVTPPRRRRSPLIHGSAAFLPEEPEETEEEKIALLEEEIEKLKAEGAWNPTV